MSDSIRSIDEFYYEFCPVTTMETDTRPWLLGCELPLPDQVRTDVAILILWHIWKGRNAKIFMPGKYVFS
jgi:hypothetical protein